MQQPGPFFTPGPYITSHRSCIFPNFFNRGLIHEPIIPRQQVRFCDIIAPLVLGLRPRMKKENLSNFISEIKNIFVLLNSSLIRGVIIEKMKYLNLNSRHLATIKSIKISFYTLTGARCTHVLLYDFSESLMI